MTPESLSALHAPAELVEDRAGLARVARRVADSDLVALDTEANSMHAYRERTCIVQVTCGGENAILDVLALEDLGPLRDALDREDVEVVFHGGDYDVSMLTRDHDFAFRRVFDTMIAATLLGEERVGLADLVADRFGATLDKRFQTADWARRPLTPPQLDYLRRDTIFLPGLREDLQARLEAADLLEEAAIEFARLAARRGRPPEPDPEGWRRIKGAARLDGPARAVLAALHAWREQTAEARDRPPFHVLSPRTMLALAGSPPRSAAGLDALGPRERRRDGDAVIAAVRRGLEAAAAGRIPPARLDARPSPAEAARRRADRRLEDALKAWRRQEAAARKVPNVVVLPNPALAWVVQARPTTVEALGACPDVGPGRAARYGAAIVERVRADAGTPPDDVTA